MPLAFWIHPITGEKVPLDAFDYDVSCDGRAAFSPALARFMAQRAVSDTRHRTLNLTATRCLTCPRQTFLEVLFPYGVNPRKAALPARGTMLHEVLAKSWNPDVYFAENVAHTVLDGVLFGMPISLQLDVMKYVRDVWNTNTSAPPRIVEIADNKFGQDGSAAYRDRVAPGVGGAGKAKFDHQLQLNIIRLVLGQQEWAVSGGYDVNNVLLTVYDYANARDDGMGVPLKCEHMTESAIAQSKPAVRQPWEDKFDAHAYERAATVEAIVRDHVWAMWRYSQVSEGLRRERSAIEGVVAPMRLIGQLGMYNGQMCDKFCDVKELCDGLVRKYGATL